jgi:hypothetical protein
MGQIEVYARIPEMPLLQPKPIIKYGNCATRVSATRKTSPGA